MNCGASSSGLPRASWAQSRAFLLALPAAAEAREKLRPRRNAGPRLAASLAALCLGWALYAASAQQSPPPAAAAEGLRVLAGLQRRAFDFFWFEAHPATGLVKDRAGNRSGDDYTVASVAATGFGLAALPVGVERGWVTRQQAEQRAVAALRFARDKMPHTNGWFHHFVDWKTGRRAWQSEVSSIDTAFFMAGALLAGEYFGGEAKALADGLYRRVDFQWMLTDGGAKPDQKLLCHGWTPESGFLKSRWDNYSEHLLLNLLAIGSPTHSIPAGCWEAWERNTGEYKGFKTFACGPLFTHQYSQAFVDFRRQRDRLGFDYFASSVQATKANRQFCLDQAAGHKTYGANVWGLSACDRPGGGYEAYGAPPGIPVHDGTVAPWATAAAVVFTPDLSLAAVGFMDGQLHAKLWGRYGFGNAFNLDKDWFAGDVIGIDLGAALLLIENHLTEKVWRWFMRMPYVTAAMSAAGFSAQADAQ